LKNIYQAPATGHVTYHQIWKVVQFQSCRQYTAMPVALSSWSHFTYAKQQTQYLVLQSP